MRRIGAWMMALLLCVVGTGCGRQLGSPISYEDFTGTYPVEGYVPSQEDLGRAPYSYAGAGPHFSVVLNVRQASEAERSVLIQGKWASAETMAQSGADFPERSEEYNALALKATEEAMALEEAEQIYLTELLVTHNGTEAEQFRYSVSDGGTLYLSGYAAGGEVWCRLANTPDGSYTEGLLLLTDDGPLGHALLSPKNHVDKVYYAKVEGRLDRTDAEALAAGMVLGDGLHCLPAELEPLGDGSQCHVTLREGKYHQVKRMLAARGKPVVYLKRLSMGPIALDPALAPGEWRPLTGEEKALLRRGTAGDPGFSAF